MYIIITIVLNYIYIYMSKNNSSGDSMSIQQRLFSGERVSKTYSMPTTMIQAIAEYAKATKRGKSVCLQELVLYGFIYKKSLAEGEDAKD